MNKGLEIRNNKLKKQAAKRATVKESQKGLVRFVTIRWEVIERVNGKYHRTGDMTANGLQIENKVFLEDGHYKLVNSKNVKIIEKFDGVPDWANDKMREQYNKSIGE